MLHQKNKRHTDAIYPTAVEYKDIWLQKWFYWLLAVGVLVNATGLFITILDSDGTLYATIAKTMAQSNEDRKSVV